MHKCRYNPYIPCPPDIKAGGNRIISSRVYVLSEVQLLLSCGGKIVITTPDADTDLEKLDWDTDDVRSLLGCLRDKHHHKSEWCLTGNRLWLDCDAYVIRFDDSEGIEDQNFPEYFVKFGFANNSVMCAIISCHLS